MGAVWWGLMSRFERYGECSVVVIVLWRRMMTESGRQSIGWLSLQGASLGLSDPLALMTAIREGDQAETRRLFNSMLVPG